MPSFRHLLIDGDILLYRTAWSTEKVGYHAAKARLDSTIMRVADKLDCHDGTIFLTGPHQFRKQVSKTSDGPAYKGNRKGAKIPQHLGQLRDYLISDYDAISLAGIEADDGMGILQCEAHSLGYLNETCLVTTDKDLDQIPGWHYNLKSLKYVTEEEADLFLYTQLITGDNADNVYGIRGMGPVKAKKYLEENPHPSSILDLYVCQNLNDPDEGAQRYYRNKLLLAILRDYPQPELLGKDVHQSLISTLDSCISSLTRKLEEST